MILSLKPAAFLALLFTGALGCGSSCAGPVFPDPETSCDTSLAAPADETAVPGQLDGNGHFVPLAAGDRMMLHFGAQGGQHVELAVRLYAKSGDVWEHSIDLYPAAGGEERLGGTSERVETCSSGWTLTTGIRVFYWGSTGTSSLTPARLVLRSEESDHAEHAVTAPDTNIVVWSP